MVHQIYAQTESEAVHIASVLQKSELVNNVGILYPKEEGQDFEVRYFDRPGVSLEPFQRV